MVPDEVKADFNLERVLPRNEGYKITSGLPPERMLVTSRKYFEDETCRPEDPVDRTTDDEIRVQRYLRSKGERIAFLVSGYRCLASFYLGIEPKFCVDMHSLPNT